MLAIVVVNQSIMERPLLQDNQLSTCVRRFRTTLRQSQVELASRAASSVLTRIKTAGFPVEKDFDTYDFSVMPNLSKPKILELARGEWIDQKFNCCLVGSHGTGKPGGVWR
jgi:DNA replication protein DnaC